jgi:molybdopterin synthase catalytic subunit
LTNGGDGGNPFPPSPPFPWKAAPPCPRAGNRRYTECVPLPAVAVTAEPLDVSGLMAVVTGDATGDGAVATFVGLVRDSNQGRRVSFLDYEAYEPLAVRALHLIQDEVRESWPGARLGIHHRIGRIELGQASVVIIAASAHRADAFAACRYTIERIKQIVPIWKHEHFEGGEVWLEGATANPDDAEARQEAHRVASGDPRMGDGHATADAGLTSG